MMSCDRFPELVRPYIEDALAEEDRKEFRCHLRECQACRELALREDPSLWLDATQTPAADLAKIDECARSVSALIHHDRLSRRLAPRRRLWAAAAAAVVVCALSLGILWRETPDHPSGSSTSETGATEANTDAPPPRLEIEPEDGDTVRVYQYAQDDEDTAVYFVVNAALES
jgi:hypothetical protein